MNVADLLLHEVEVSDFFQLQKFKIYYTNGIEIHVCNHVEGFYTFYVYLVVKGRIPVNTINTFVIYKDLFTVKVAKWILNKVLNMVPKYNDLNSSFGSITLSKKGLQNFNIKVLSKIDIDKEVRIALREWGLK